MSDIVKQLEAAAEASSFHSGWCSPALYREAAAEIKHLREYADAATMRLKQAEAEIERLRAEIERQRNPTRSDT